ncbi:class I SAM-dependent methyltransferase [Ottowia sp.]|uniref:class I SAM-dependent methyltransferase n=1 Tax=Ottowia sp. TaxID=1898956 RepID=UPI0039E262D4
MATDLPPTIDPVAARRWAARPHARTPWLHEEVARRMAERLAVIRLPVRRWAHWEPARSGLAGHELVAAHYPDAESFRVSAQAGRAPATIEKEATPWWRRWGRAQAPATVAAPPQGAMQLVWANMLAHQVADPQALLADWHRALAPDGFVMFSCLGPDTLRELRALYAAEGWPPPAQAFTDMHDWGDQLVAAGFAEPVMDMEHLTLTYDTPVRLLADLRELGRNQHPGRHAALRAPAWRRRLETALDERLRPPGGGPLRLTFELIYGHALKAAPRHALAPETAIPLTALQDALRQRHRKPGAP